MQILFKKHTKDFLLDNIVLFMDKKKLKNHIPIC